MEKLKGYLGILLAIALLVSGFIDVGPTYRTPTASRITPLDRTLAGTAAMHLSDTALRADLLKALQILANPWVMGAAGLAATLLGAASVPLLGARMLGMLQTRAERDAATHSARYLGWLMGVEERWLPTDEASAMRLLYEFLLSISNPDETSVQLAQPMADEPLSRPYPRWAAAAAFLAMPTRWPCARRRRWSHD